MASIYEKPPLFKLQKTWNEKTILPEVYKLMSPNPRSKNKAEIHKDSGLYGIEFIVDKTIPDFNKGADKVQLDYARAFIEFENVLKGVLNSAWSMLLKNTSQNRSMTQQALYCRSPTETLRKVSRVPLNSSFSVVRMRRILKTSS